MIVTSFSQQGLEEYGRKFIETYYEHCHYPLVVYYENEIPDIDGPEYRNLYDIPGCEAFLYYAQKYDGKTKSGYDYRQNVHKFARKTFAINHASKQKGVMAWMDADSVFFNDIPETFLGDIIRDAYVAYLGRENMHSECGFMVFNTGHPINNLFMDLMLRVYTTGVFKNLDNKCDSSVFDFTRNLLTPPEINLGRGCGETHPFINSIIGKYVDHLKGPRKQLGHSLEEEYFVNDYPYRRA